MWTQRRFIGLICRILLLSWLVSGVCAAQGTGGIDLAEVLRITLDNSDNIKLYEEQVGISKGRLQSSSGRFDVIFNSELAYSRNDSPLTESNRMVYGVSDLTTKTTANNNRFSKQFRWGTTATTGLEITRTESLSVGPAPTNRSRVYFQIIQPVLKGRGTDSTGAYERALEKEWEASQLDLAHAVGETVRDTVIAYWRYLASVKTLEILKESERRAEKLVKDTQTLIEADERPRSDLVQLKANLADKVAARMNAEQTVTEARHALGLMMSIPLDDIFRLGTPADDFSAMDESLSRSSISAERCIERAMASRADLIASKKRETAADILLVAARKNMQPQMDFFFDAGYAGLEEGSQEDKYLTAFGENTTGLNITAGISLDLPIVNHLARGELRSRLAERRQQGIRTRELTRRIKSNVVTALSSLHSSAAELAKSRESKQHYLQTIESERKKLKLGMSTLIDVVIFEDRLTGALSNMISQHLRFATALIRLRYETGTLISKDSKKPDINSLDPFDLKAVPEL